MSALQYGLSGLAALLFGYLVSLLRTEQARTDIRPEFLRAIYIAMAFSFIMLVVPAGVEIFTSMNGSGPLQAKIDERDATIQKLQANNKTLGDALTDAKKANDELSTKVNEAALIKERLKGEVGGLSMIEDAKPMYVFNAMPEGDSKQVLLGIVGSMCNAIQDLKDLAGLPPQPQKCTEVQKVIGHG